MERTTPAERVAMVWTLTREAWSLAGLAVPEYPREGIPLRVVEPDAAPPSRDAP